MRRLKMIFLGLGCIAALCLTSCIKDDDSDSSSGLSKAEITRCYNAVLGDYYGKLVYPATNPENYHDGLDTLDVQWTVNADTTLFVKGFPASAVVEQLRDTELKKALQEQSTLQNTKCQMVFTSLQNSYVQFALGAEKIAFPISYKDADHTLNVYFWADGSSFGEKDITSGDMIVRLVMGGAYLDDDTKTNLFTGNNYDAISVPIFLTTALK
ncbi:MAG: DUF4840 domain-containing protein [Prevotella sp.]|nr:DUF4840 domain-containing protein [Prevotella sp.]